MDALVVAPTQPARGQLLVRVLGDVDLSSADRLQAVLTDAVTALAAERDQSDDKPILVCDMQDVEFLGASGLGALVSVAAYAAEHDVTWSVVATCTAVRRPLQLVALEDHVPLTSTSPLHHTDNHVTEQPSELPTDTAGGESAATGAVGER